MLFFVSVGMLLDPLVLRDQLGALAFVVAAIVTGKAAILAGVVRAFGYRHVVPLAVGLTLFQVGEFAFVLARVGLSSGAISNEVYTLVLNAAIFTMALTPVLSGQISKLYERFRPQHRSRETYEAINIPATGLRGHVVIAGGGSVGRSVADALTSLGLPYVLVDLDDRQVQRARSNGFPVIYGDAAQPVVLEAADIERARALLITLPAFADVRAIATAGRQLRPGLPIIARAETEESLRGLSALGIAQLTSPQFEAAIEMTRQVLEHFDVPAEEILRVGNAIREDRFKIPEFRR
jgi:CPA2 family monovalent cation:H+ antiporter-2